MVGTAAAKDRHGSVNKLPLDSREPAERRAFASSQCDVKALVTCQDLRRPHRCGVSLPVGRPTRRRRH